MTTVAAGEADRAGTAGHGQAARSRWREPARFLLCFVPLVTMFGCWSLSVPLLSGPDEGSEVVRAAAAGRGDLSGRPDPPGATAGSRSFRLPIGFGQAGAVPSCYLHHPEASAACAPAIASTRGRRVPVPATAGRTRPLAVLVGGASRFFDGAKAMYAMRLTGAVIAAALVASALLSASSSRAGRVARAGVLVALTPAAAYLAGVVGPSGVAVAAAVCVWSAGAALLSGSGGTGEPELELRRHARRAAVGGAVLAMSTGGGVFWVALILSVLALTSSRSGLRELASRRAVRYSAAALVVACASAVAWRFVAASSGSAGATTAVPAAAAIRQAIGDLPRWLDQMIAGFGHLDARAPALTYDGWLLAIGLLIVLGASRADRHARTALVALVAIVIVVPVGLQVAALRTHPHRLVGRLLLPVAVGIPVLAAMASGRGDGAGGLATRRVVVVVGLVAAVAHVAAYLGVIHRYAVGVNGPIDYLVGVHWSPTISLGVLLGLFVLSSVALVAAAALLPGGSPESEPATGSLAESPAWVR